MVAKVVAAAAAAAVWSPEVDIADREVRSEVAGVSGERVRRSLGSERYEGDGEARRARANG